MHDHDGDTQHTPHIPWTDAAPEQLAAEQPRKSLWSRVHGCFKWGRKQTEIGVQVDIAARARSSSGLPGGGYVTLYWGWSALFPFAWLPKLRSHRAVDLDPVVGVCTECEVAHVNGVFWSTAAFVQVSWLGFTLESVSTTVSNIAVPSVTEADVAQMDAASAVH